MRLEGKNAAEGGETGSLDIHGDLTEHRPAAGQSDMRVFYGFDALPHFVRPTVTVGSYDGVHSGHLALLRTVAGRARAQGGESVVLTFEPHPRVTLGRADGLRLLTSLEEKIYLLGQQGIDNLIVIPFDKDETLNTFELQLMGKKKGTDTSFDTNDDKEYILQTWSVKLDDASIDATLKDTEYHYSIYRNHLYQIGKRGGGDDPDKPGVDPDKPQPLDKSQELVIKINDQWEFIHDLEID